MRLVGYLKRKKKRFNTFFVLYLKTEADPAYETLFPYNKDERMVKPDMHKLKDTKYSQVFRQDMTALQSTVRTVHIGTQTQLHAL